MGRDHGPHPGAPEHAGFSMSAASQSPSISSSQSSGLTASGSGIMSGSSSSQPEGFTAVSSRICLGAFSSQSSGLLASGSGIFSLSSQSDGLESVGSSISAGGLTGGVKESSSDPWLTRLWSMLTSNVLSGLTTSLSK